MLYSCIAIKSVYKGPSPPGTSNMVVINRRCLCMRGLSNIIGSVSLLLCERSLVYLYLQTRTWAYS